MFAFFAHRVRPMTLLADCVVQARKKRDAQHYAKALKRSLLACFRGGCALFTQTFCRLFASEPADVTIFSLRLTTLGGAVQWAVASFYIFSGSTQNSESSCRLSSGWSVFLCTLTVNVEPRLLIQSQVRKLSHLLFGECLENLNCPNCSRKIY